ncbi:MAG: hypothetical protein N4A61_11175 [Pelagimonas sp.]|jgi:hypothetical protein|nr:hypothetical protein [Pelagimonas sp.]
MPCIIFQADNSRRLFLATVAFVGPAHADIYKRIDTAADFNTHIVDKKLVFEHGTARIRADGSTGGRLKKQGKFYGNWIWQSGYYCRNLVIAGEQTGTDCQLVEVSGNTARFTRNRGGGYTTHIDIK